MAPMLRYVTVRGKPGEIVEEKYENYSWIPVLAREVDELHFQIMTMDNKEMPFQYGSVTMTLVFKRAMGA